MFYSNKLNPLYSDLFHCVNGTVPLFSDFFRY